MEITVRDKNGTVLAKAAHPEEVSLCLDHQWNDGDAVEITAPPCSHLWARMNAAIPEGEIYCPGHELWFDDDYVPQSKLEEFIINKLSGVEPIDYAQLAEMAREIAKDEILDSTSEIDFDELIDQMSIEITPETTLREICKNAMVTALIVAHNLIVNA